MTYEKTAQRVALKLLDDNGYLKILPAAAYEEFTWEELRLFCHFYARYGLPTTELIEWLKQIIDGKSAIEIGSGCGDLGRALDIPMIDNHCQEWPDVRFYYLSAGQPLIHYGENIERIDALEAAKKYKPDIIIGQWITHWIDPTRPVPEGGGNMYGVKEDLLLKECKTYVMIGNRKVHGFKPILKMQHTEVLAPFIKSRAHQPDENVIYIWNSEKSSELSVATK